MESGEHLGQYVLAFYTQPAVSFNVHLSLWGHRRCFNTFSGISSTSIDKSHMSLVLHAGPQLWGCDSWPNSGHLPLSFWSWRHLLPTNAVCSWKIPVGHHWVWTPQRPLFQGDNQSYVCHYVILWGIFASSRYDKIPPHINLWVGGLWTIIKLRDPTLKADEPDA